MVSDGFDAAGNTWSNTIGQMLGDLSDAVFLADPTQQGCPLLWTSREFCQRTGFPSDELNGKSWDCLLAGVPEQYISRSSQQNFNDYIQACRTAGLSRIAEVSSVQPNKRKDGSVFVNFLLFGLCQVHDRPCILGVSLCLAEGPWVKTTKAQTAQALQDARSVLKRTRCLLDTRRSGRPTWPRHEGLQSEFAFYADRLQSHSMLVGGGFSAVRREAEKIPRGCLLFGDRPVRRKAGQGLAFDVRVDHVSSSFSGFPVLGFTQRRPEDGADLYPSASKCCGASVLIGGLGTASVRHQEGHFQIGFKPPPAVEVSECSAWLPEAGDAGTTELRDGDLLRCICSEDGRLEFVRNGEMILAHETGQPLDPKVEYFAVVDVCLAARAVTLLPRSHTDIDDGASEATRVSSRPLTSSPLTSTSVGEWTSDADADMLPEMPPRSASFSIRTKLPSTASPGSPTISKKRPKTLTGSMQRASELFRRSIGA